MRREKALKSFKADESEIKVILISLRTAASGSNLIQATHIILMGILF
jgi:SNF2 family DNA or RNA helicase